MKEELIKDWRKHMQLMRTLSKRAEWVGEDGEAVCVARTEKAAWSKFKTLMKEEVGEIEAREMKERYTIGRVYLNLFSPEESQEHEGAEWYASLIDKSPYELWMIS